MIITIQFTQNVLIELYITSKATLSIAMISTVQRLTIRVYNDTHRHSSMYHITGSIGRPHFKVNYFSLSNKTRRFHPYWL